LSIIVIENGVALLYGRIEEDVSSEAPERWCSSSA
jgi:hypothetical protein